MITIEDVKRLSSGQGLIQFADFILSQYEGGQPPNYKNMNLMDIHKLVPNIFVYDVLNSQERLRLKFCGTLIDEIFGINMTGKCPYDWYKGEDSYDEIESIIRETIQTQIPSFTRRKLSFKNEFVNKIKVAESIVFPCSSGDDIVDYTIGYVEYYHVPESVEKLITLIK